MSGIGIELNVGIKGDVALQGIAQSLGHLLKLLFLWLLVKKLCCS